MKIMTFLKQLRLSMNKIPLSYGFARLLLSRCLSLQSSCQCLGKYKHYLTNNEASTVLCSAVKHLGSGRARKKCRVKHETQSSVFPTS